MKKNNYNQERKEERKVMNVDGFMTVDKLENGLVVADFQCCEDVQMEAFCGDFKVQGMRDGNVYLTEKPKRVKNKALFREDNSSLSYGRNGKFYFCFSLDGACVGELPAKLVRQASAIAQKVIKEML